MLCRLTLLFDHNSRRRDTGSDRLLAHHSRITRTRLILSSARENQAARPALLVEVYGLIRTCRRVATTHCDDGVHLFTLAFTRWTLSASREVIWRQVDAKTNDNHGDHQNSNNQRLHRASLAYSVRRTSIIISAARSIVSSVDKCPSVSRRLPSATCSGRWIASSTCERVPLFAAQALPVATRTPRASRPKTTRSASIDGNEICRCPARRCFW
ncbi:hypothetical protein D9M68_749380 [compost metagenome]